jgi:hypothetical protein
MRAGRVAVGEVRAPDSDASGAFTAKIYWRLYAERLVAPIRRKVSGAFMPKTVWLLNGESSHWEYKGGFFNAKGVKIPVAVNVFPGEQYQARRSWTGRAYPNLVYYNKVDKGGHFAAWEHPTLFVLTRRAHPKFDGYSSRCATDASSPRQAWRLRGW